MDEINAEIAALFLLTHPVWDVTALAVKNYAAEAISTHTSRVGCDNRTRRHRTMRKISTHTSRVGCDQAQRSKRTGVNHFYSHIPCGM